MVCRGGRFTERMACVAECMMASNGKERMAPEKCGEVDYNYKAVPARKWLLEDKTILVS